MVWEEMKRELQEELLRRLNPSALGGDRMSRQRLLLETEPMLASLVAEKRFPLNRQDRLRLLREVQQDMFLYGPITPLLDDPTVSNIFCNGPHDIFVERNGRTRREPGISFRDQAHLHQIIERIVIDMNRRIDEAWPMVDARLHDGSRVHIIIPPVALNGPYVSIRRYLDEVKTPHDLLRLETLNSDMLELLSACVRARLNLLVAGQTGSGKTTLLNVLCQHFVGDEERIVTIEDPAEFTFRKPNMVRLEARQPNLEGRGEVTQGMLFRESLRMQPDRIIVGEVRDYETLWQMCQAMMTGHDGSLCTIHANSCHETIARLFNIFSMRPEGKMSEETIATMIAASIDLIVYMERLADGRRIVSAIAEVAGRSGSEVFVREIYLFEHEGIAPDGRALGNFRPTGYVPALLARLKKYSVRPPAFLELAGTL